MVPSVMQLARESRAVGAMPVLYQSWGYRDGDERRFHDDFFAMNQRLREGCHAAARVEGLPIARVGDAWENEMAKGRGARLFMPDGLHPSRDGVRLNAQVFYEAFFCASGRAEESQDALECREAHTQRRITHRRIRLERPTHD